MSKVLVVGLNPAWQKVLEFPALRLGEVNRARAGQSLASGKGFNTAKVLSRLGHEVWLLQVLGGANGRRCLEACEALGIRSVAAWVDEETRECLTLLENGESSGKDDGVGVKAATEIIEPFAISKPGLDRELLAELPAAPDAFEAVAVCGTIPAGLSADIYGDLLARYAPKVSVVDAWQGLDASSLAKVSCAKMNAEELGMLKQRVGYAFADPSGPLFAITAGPGEAYMLRGGRTLARYAPPRLDAVVNPIGAGDTVTAGLVHHLTQGCAAPEAFRRALAMGSASCLNRLPAEYAEADYLRLLAMVEMQDGGGPDV